ncbi:MAG: hypothetical protein R3E40_12855 [Rhodocyclaceae bacterium]
MARATGCGECRSTAAARAATSAEPITSTTAISPLESVPVLSRATTSTRGDFSKRSGPVTTMPRRSASPIAAAVVSGMARPKVHGQETMSVASAASSAFSAPAPAARKPMPTSAASASTPGTKRRERRSTGLQPGARALRVPEDAGEVGHAAFHLRAGVDLQVALEQAAAAEHLSPRRATPGRARRS